MEIVRAQKQMELPKVGLFIIGMKRTSVKEIGFKMAEIILQKVKGRNINRSKETKMKAMK